MTKQHSHDLKQKNRQTPVQARHGGVGGYKKHHATGIKRPSSSESLCEIASSCRSCLYINTVYHEQLVRKKKHFQEMLLRSYSLLKDVPIDELYASPSISNYRHHAKLVMRVFEQSRSSFHVQIGLYQPQSHYVVDIGVCAVQNHLMNQVVSFLRQDLVRIASVYSLTHVLRLLRYVTIKIARDTQQILVTFVQSSEDTALTSIIARHLQKRFPKLMGVVHHVNKSKGNEIITHDAALGQDIVVLGESFILESYNALKFRIGHASFMQVNPFIAATIYKTLSELIPFNQCHVLDLYCGIGTISLHLAKLGATIYGIDENPQAIEDAKYNAVLNQLAHLCEFKSGRVEDLLNVGHELPKIDIAVLNPSRRGCQRTVLEYLVQAKIKHIIYLSCYPQTLLRDVATLKELSDCQVKFFKIFDMFPHTPHYETLTLITLL